MTRPKVYVLHPRRRWWTATDGRIYIVGGASPTALTGAVYGEILRKIDGQRSDDEIAEARPLTGQC